MKIKLLLPVLMIMAVNVALADQVSIQFAKLYQQGGSWNVSVTLKHGDTGWSHYANAWQLVDAQNNLLAKRVLSHPHVNEQPFTRGLSAVNIPKNIKVIFIEATDSVHGLSTDRLRIDLTQSTGERYTVNR